MSNTPFCKSVHNFIIHKKFGFCEPIYLHNCILYMNATLTAVASIFNGYSFRDTTAIRREGATAVIQMKDLKENGFSVDDVEGFTDLTRIDERHLLQPSDVLLLTKGQRTLAIRVAATYPRVIASAAFLVIRPDTSQLDSGYLHWYLNQPEAQTWFEMGRERSATVMAVPLSVVQSLPIPLPSLEQQRSIGVLGRLTAREHYLSVQIARKRQTLRNQKLNQLIDLVTTTNQSA